MSIVDYSDENVIKSQLLDLVHREAHSVFKSLDLSEAEFRDAAAGLDGADRTYIEAKIHEVREDKLEMMNRFKAMHDFLQ